LITVLTVMVGALLLQIVQSYATQTAALGSAIVTVDALHMVLIAVLVFLVLRQVMPIAAGLAGGVSLNSMGLLSRSVRSGLRSSGWAAGKGAGLWANYAAPPFLGGIRGTLKRTRSTVLRATGYQFGRTDDK
jgi:hypothetical protein